MELIITLIFSVITAILGSIFWPMFGKKIQKPTCKLLTRNDTDEQIQAVINFYLERISFEERIPPNYITHFLRSKIHSPERIDQIGRMCSKSEEPIHVLLYVELDQRVIGVCKLMYICQLRSFFIAYYAARPSENASSSDILNAIMTFFHSHAGDFDNIYYEICLKDEHDKEFLAKDRLFRHYARSRGFEPTLLLKSYLQPEISAFEDGQDDTTPARLFALAKSADSVKKYAPEFVVEQIYDKIYAHSFSAVDPNNVARYREYLEIVRSLIPFNNAVKSLPSP